MKITVAVGDDHPVVRAGLVQMLTASELIDVVAEADDGTQLLDAIRALRPQVALSDFRMPGLDGAGLALAAQQERLPTRVLVLSAYGSPARTSRVAIHGMPPAARSRFYSAGWSMVPVSGRYALAEPMEPPPSLPNSNSPPSSARMSSILPISVP